jgi:AraC-type DNA-binding domain-containing proteins
MNLKNLFFHIHYCSGRQGNEPGKGRTKFTRTLQHHELIFVSEGEGTITVDKKRYQCKAGMLFYICPNVPHSVDLDIDMPGTYRTVHFSFANVNFNDGEWVVTNDSEVIPLQPGQQLQDYYQVDDAFKKLLEIWNMKLPGYEFAARTQLQQLIIAIHQNIRKQNPNYATALKVDKVIQFMHQNINGKITLTELAEMSQLSPYYLSRTFKEITGYSVIEYFNKIKIDKSKELFIEGGKKVKEVAEALGFADEFYFSRVFKKIEGISPSEYYSKIIHGS